MQFHRDFEHLVFHDAECREKLGVTVGLFQSFKIASIDAAGISHFHISFIFFI